MTSVALKIALLKVIQHSIALKQQFTLLQIELRKNDTVLKDNFSRAEIVWYGIRFCVVYNFSWRISEPL